ncbi:MAG: hypothetical protein JWM46_455 [Candidatus Kaiserbacteria bacterium]|nr:hypothetical protein [Candidatus Kaiserbacteria bacterium]
MKDTSLVMGSVRHNLSLYVALRELSAPERVTYLVDHLHKTIDLAADNASAVDEYLHDHIETLTRALLEAEAEGINATRRCASIAGDLFAKCTVPNVLALPQAIDRLCSRIVTCWVSVPDEAEASEVIKSLGKLYLSTANEGRHHAINRAVNRVRDECSPLRVAHAVVALDSLADWDYSEEGNLHDAIIFNLLKAQRKTNLAGMRRMAHLEIVIGDVFSPEAEKALLESATAIKRVDESAKKLVDDLGRRWHLHAIDAGTNTVTLRKESNTGPLNHDMVMDALNNAQDQIGKMTTKGGLNIRLEIFCEGNVIGCRDNIEW